MIDAVCFDLFETLITEYVADYQPTPSLAERLQIEPSLFARAWTALTPARFRGELADFPATLREICRKTGREAPDELLAQLDDERARQKARPFAQIDNGILLMLQELRKRGLKLGLISNASSEEVTAWQSSQLAPFFDATVFSCHIGHVKPEAEIYLLTCEMLGAKPGATLFVGDGSSDELMGAQRAGLTPYWSTWFIDRWPFARPSSPLNEQFLRLKEPAALVAVVDKLQRDSTLAAC